MRINLLTQRAIQAQTMALLVSLGLVGLATPSPGLDLAQVPCHRLVQAVCLPASVRPIS